MQVHSFLLKLEIFLYGQRRRYRYRKMDHRDKTTNGQKRKKEKTDKVRWVKLKKVRKERKRNS